MGLTFKQLHSLFVGEASPIELRRVHQIKKCSLGVRAGNHRLCRNLFSVGQHNAGHGAVLRSNLRHFRIRPNLRARRPSRFGQRIRKFSESAANKRRRPRRICIRRRAQQQHRRRSRRPRPQRGSKYPARRNHGAYQFRLEKLGRKIGTLTPDLIDELLAEF